MHTLTRRQVLVALAAALALPLYYEILTWRATGTLGFPLDDAWIHAQFARNLATGHGFTYTGDRWVAGSTSPAWTILLAAGYFLTRSILIAAKSLGLVLQLACALVAARLVFFLTESRALAVGCGVLLLATPAMVWGVVSGMEIGLTVFLTLGGIYLYVTAQTRRRQVGAMILLTAACLARPEALVLLAAVTTHFLARSGSTSEFARRAAAVLAVGVVVLGPFVVFDYATTGRPLPTTFYAKSGPGLFRVLADGNRELTARLFFTHGPNALRKFVETLFDQYGMAAVVMLAGFVAALTNALRRRGALLVAVSVVIACFGMGLVAPMRLKPENFRYTAEFICLAAVLGIAGLSVVARFVRPIGVIVLLTLVIASAGYKAIRSAPIYACSVKNIEELHVSMAGWMRDHLAPGTRIAVNDIGALAYFSGHEIIDLEGLVSPDALQHPRPERGVGFSRATKPDYIVIFPTWYPDISGQPNLFREVHRISIPDNVVSAGDVMIVYSTPWTRSPVISFPVRRERRQRWPA